MNARKLLQAIRSLIQSAQGRLFLSSSTPSSHPQLITFFIPLRMPLPMPLETLSFERSEEVEWLEWVPVWPTREAMDADVDPTVHNGRNFVSLRFWNSKKPLPIATDLFDAAAEIAAIVTGTAGNAEHEAEDSPAMPWDENQVSLTVVEAVTPFLTTADDEERSISECLDRCLEHIEEVAQAYRLATWDLFSVPVNRSSVYAVALLTVRNLPDGRYGPLSPFLVNFGQQHFPAPPRVISESKLDDTMYLLRRARNKDPFTPVMQYRWNSDRALRVEGDATGAILHAAISSEVFFNTLLLSMAWEEGVSPLSASLWFSENLPKRLRSRYQNRLGGNWDTYNAETAVGKWFANLYRNRNRVVHTGYIATVDEATLAVEAYDELEEFICSRLAERRNQYPRTSLLVLGTAGLERRGCYSGKMRRFVENHAGQETHWTIELTSFMDEVERQMGQRYGARTSA